MLTGDAATRDTSFQAQVKEQTVKVNPPFLWTLTLSLAHDEPRRFFAAHLHEGMSPYVGNL